MSFLYVMGLLGGLALFLYGMNVIDCGVPVISMHAPFEAISKADIYEVYKGYEAFLKKMK